MDLETHLRLPRAQAVFRKYSTQSTVL